MILKYFSIIAVLIALSGFGMASANHANCGNPLTYYDNIFRMNVTGTFNGTDGNDLIIGTAGDDIIYGLGGNDCIFGKDGLDTIYGGSGDDFILGGNHADILYGEDGNDTLIGNRENDFLYGGAGNDILQGRAQDDYIDGGEGDDIIGDSKGVNIIYGGSGTNQCTSNEDSEIYCDESAPRTEPVIDLVIIAGQSNVTGKGGTMERLLELFNMTATQPQSDWEYLIEENQKKRFCDWKSKYCDFEKYPFIKTIASNMTSSLVNGYVYEDMLNARDDVWVEHYTKDSHINGTLQFGFGAKPSMFGPELPFGTIVGDALNTPVFILKVSQGGTSITNGWCSPNMYDCEPGTLYNLLIQVTNQHIQDLELEYDQVNVKLIWWQGWNDGKFCVNYLEQFPTLLSDFRNDLNMPNLEIIIAESHRSCVGYPGGVGDVQRIVADADPLTSSFMTNDLSPWYHYGVDSYLIIGDRMAQSYLNGTNVR